MTVEGGWKRQEAVRKRQRRQGTAWCARKQQGLSGSALGQQGGTWGGFAQQEAALRSKKRLCAARGERGMQGSAVRGKMREEATGNALGPPTTESF